ncbi:MAG: dihydrodipicolinate synthase family protein [Acidobacteriota bacterium]|nr:MAG: dihydrodipicolinate synthase family protein [Acidobacteriota bacterium]
MDQLFNRIRNSVLAVPPLARSQDFSLNEEENRRLVNHLTSGGIRTLLYGGNANLYHVGPSEFSRILDFLSRSVPEDVWVIPSVGPAFGTMMDQADVLEDFNFDTVMILPSGFPLTQAGIELGIRKFCEKSGLGVLLYLKQDGYLHPERVASLVDDGLVTAIKYAVVREDPSRDEYLTALIDRVDPRRIISGIGEQPAIIHWREFGLGSFTSGCVCIAPALSMEMLAALKAGDFERAETIRKHFKPLEDLRNAHGPIPVLHEAVRLAGVADTGPMLPLMTNLAPQFWNPVQKATRGVSASPAPTK